MTRRLSIQHFPSSVFHILWRQCTCFVEDKKCAWDSFQFYYYLASHIPSLRDDVVCAVFLCVHTTASGGCTNIIRVCVESWHWKKNFSLPWRVEPATAACRTCHLSYIPAPVWHWFTALCVLHSMGPEVWSWLSAALCLPTLMETLNSISILLSSQIRTKACWTHALLTPCIITKCQQLLQFKEDQGEVLLVALARNTPHELKNNPNDIAVD